VIASSHFTRYVLTVRTQALQHAPKISSAAAERKRVSYACVIIAIHYTEMITELIATRHLTRYVPGTYRPDSDAAACTNSGSATAERKRVSYA